MSKKYNLLILSDDDQTKLDWQKSLRKNAIRCITAVDEVPASIVLDVLITDWTEQRVLPILDRLQWQAGQLGVIRVGEDGSGDVWLPSNSTGRELSLACQLLTKWVRTNKELKKSQRKIRLQSILAITDHLTGLHNRRALEVEFLKQSTATEEGEANIVKTTATDIFTIIDIDRFKEINQQEGFLQGDQVLKTVAAGLQEFTDEHQMVVRLGGDEFALFTKAEDISTSIQVFQSLVEQLTQHVHEKLGKEIYFSVGVAAMDEPSANDNTLDVLIERADLALRAAKKTPGNMVVFDSNSKG